jgi:hypothetical protein
MEESEYKRTKAILDTAKKRDVPDFEHTLDMRNECIRLLMINLVQYRPFIERMNQLRLKYEKCDEIKERPLASIESLSQSFQTMKKQAQEYLKDISSIVSDYGLNPDWARELIHEGINDFDSLATGLDCKTIDEEFSFNITWNTEKLSSKKEAFAQVKEQFNEQWDLYEQYLKSIGFNKRRKKGALGNHVIWTFKKVCLHMAWHELAQDEGLLNAESLRKPVYQIIKLLGLNSTN